MDGSKRAFALEDAEFQVQRRDPASLELDGGHGRGLTNATRAQAVSSTLTDLSGSCRPTRYRAESLTQSTIASSRMRTPW
jgi:hypothetical protein